ncbi:hypothetical protein P7C70_g7797, partial [Phenoliferia sp. Uapishka_3]
MQLAKWAIRAPSSPTLPDDYQLYNFTSVQSDKAAPISLPSLTPTSARRFENPSVKHFRSPQTPTTIGQHAKRQAPLLSLHVSTWSNCQAVGITVPHGVFDAVGLGLVIRALDAELTGENWEVPELSESNLLELLRNAAGNVPIATTNTPDRLQFTGSAKRPWDVVRFLWSAVHERYWQWCTRGDIFVGRAILERFVKKVKEEVGEESGGKEWVSTGDVLAAWTVKALFSLEPKGCDSLLLGTLYDFRSTLSPPPISSLSQYPHNAIAPILLPPFSVASLATTSLSNLALQHRRAITQQRQLGSLLENLTWSETFKPIPGRRSGTVGLVISNQVRAGLTRTRWGAEEGQVAGWWEWGLEDVMDHIAAWNELDDGWVMSIMTRPIRWKALEGELEKLEKDFSECKGVPA